MLIGLGISIFCILVGGGMKNAKHRRMRIANAQRFDVPKTLGNARFSSDADARKGNLLTGGGLWLAFSRASGRVFRWAADTHLISIGPTGCGKSMSLIAMILELGRMVLIANDPKGQLLIVCQKARLKVGPVLALNPFGIHKGVTDKRVKQVRYNPMATLHKNDPLLGIKCDKIADGLVWSDGDDKSRFWNDGAKELLSGLMMALICHGSEQDKNLATLCDVLCGDIYGYCRAVVTKTDNRYVKARLAPYAVEGEAQVRSVVADTVSTARVNTQFIRNEVLGPSLSASDFSFRELRDQPCSLFLVLPVDASSDLFDRYYRLIMASALAEMLSENCLGKTRVLFALDEAGSLGKMRALEQAIAISRGFGIQIWTIFTDIPAMRRIYGDGFRSLIANSGCRIFYPPNDTVTSEEISKLSGQTEVISHSRSVSYDLRTGEPHVNDSRSQLGVPLLRPEDVRDLNAAEDLIIFAHGVKGVILAKRKPYWKTHPGQFCPDPYEKKARREW